MLQEPQNLRFVRQAPGEKGGASSVFVEDPEACAPHHIHPKPGPAPLQDHLPTQLPDSLVNTDLLHLGDQHLQQAHDGLQRQLGLPGQDLREPHPELRDKLDLAPEPQAPQDGKCDTSNSMHGLHQAGPVKGNCC